MDSIFGENGEHVLVLIAHIGDLSAAEVDQVTCAWKLGNPRDRARAWAWVNRAVTEQERYRILAAASLARREALETSRRLRRKDWAFWAAACDAAAAVAAGSRIGPHYDTLIAPFAAVMPSLAHCPGQSPDEAADFTRDKRHARAGIREDG